ncbi:hypothetical protein HNY73_002888 [Argiope bruennichi]|uniref:PiggyBac transposable element-derived protein domain-containing protein n=1 Tax=Argiope bruennichi TaxID=94029 RepID=A0A8T0FV53_ARGBR|nr:hypothetical protein HNY73_002888 [Argiope bruennichi]
MKQSHLEKETVNEYASFPLQEPCHNTGRNFIMDSYFTSLKLLKRIRTAGTSCNYTTNLLNGKSTLFIQKKKEMRSIQARLLSMKMHGACMIEEKMNKNVFEVHGIRYWKSHRIKKNIPEVVNFTIQQNMKMRVCSRWPENTQYNTHQGRHPV